MTAFRELLRAYFVEHWAFVLLHLAFAAFALRWYFRVSAVLRQDLAVCRATQRSWASLQESASSSNSAARHLKHAIDAWALGASVDLDASASSYGDEQDASIATGDRYAALFLLTGVVGTLFGVYAAAESAGDASISFGRMFAAFSVTIFAVAFSIVIHIGEGRLRAALAAVEPAFRDALAAVLRSSPRSESAVAPVLERLEASVVRLTSVLNDPKTVIDSMQSIHATMAAVGGSLQTVSRDLHSVTGAVDMLPDAVKRSFSASTEAVTSAHTRMAESFDNSIAAVRATTAQLEDTVRKLPDLVRGASAETHQQLRAVVEANRVSVESLVTTERERLSSAAVSLGEAIGRIDANWGQFNRAANELVELVKVAKASVGSVDSVAVQHAEMLRGASGQHAETMKVASAELLDGVRRLERAIQTFSHRLETSERHGNARNANGPDVPKRPSRGVLTALAIVLAVAMILGWTYLGRKSRVPPTDGAAPVGASAP